MANEENLKKGKKTQFKSGEQAARAGHKGGIASGKAKRRNKSLQEMTRMVLKQPLNEIGREKLEQGGFNLAEIDDSDITMMLSVVGGMVVAAANGNSQAGDLVRRLYDNDQIRKSEQLERDKLAAEIDVLKAKVRALEGTAEESQDDGFLEALKDSADDDWKGEDDAPPE